MGMRFSTLISVLIGVTLGSIAKNGLWDGAWGIVWDYFEAQASFAAIAMGVGWLLDRKDA